MCFNIEYSCHTITNIIHGRRLSLQLMTNLHVTTAMLVYLFSIFFRTNIFHNPHKKEYTLKFSQLKKHVSHLKFVYCFT